MLTLGRVLSVEFLLFEMKETSLRARYAYKLVANSVGMVTGFVVETMAARGLGARVYGDFHFLNNFFQQSVSLFEFGSMIAFYTKLSRRQTEAKLVRFYWLYVAVMVALLFIAVFAAWAAGQASTLWPAQSMSSIGLAVSFAAVLWLANVAGKMTDAYGFTVPAEKARMVLRLSAVFILAGLFFSGYFSLTGYFIWNVMASLALFGAFARVVIGSGQSFAGRALNGEAKKYIREFYTFCHPLIVFGIISAAATLADIWMLQHFAGSIEQGYYGLALRISAVCLVFTTAMTPLIAREFAVAHAQQNRQRMIELFLGKIPQLYVITAILAAFVFVHADTVAILIGGNQYHDAAPAVAILALYPLQQTYGQLSGSIFYATEQTALYRNIGAASIVAGVPLSYFLLSDHLHWGMNAGAIGLAAKTVIVSAVAINVQLYFNTRLLGLYLWRLMLHQLVTLVTCLLLAATSRLLIEHTINVSSPFVRLIGAAVIYMSFLAGSLYFFPAWAGLSWEVLRRLSKELINPKYKEHHP